MFEGKVYLIKGVKRGLWGFPKGHIEAGQNEYRAAVRELMEETGLTPHKILLEQGLECTYVTKKDKKKVIVEKTVMYFVAEVMGKPQQQASQVKEIALVTIEEAFQRLSRDADKLILLRAIKFLQA